MCVLCLCCEQFLSEVVVPSIPVTMAAEEVAQEVASSSPVPQPPAVTELCILAKRVPKVKTSGDPDQDEVLEDQRTFLVGVIQHLKEHPEKNLACRMALATGKIVVA